MQADYVLPASSQFEKAEATFFNLEFPRNGFHLRQPLFEPRAGTLTEAEIHARLSEALVGLDDRHYRLLRRAARLGSTAFALAFAWKAKRDERMARHASGRAVPDSGCTDAREHGGRRIALGRLPDVRPAQPGGGAASRLPRIGAQGRHALFDAIMGAPSGTTFAVSEYDDSWQAIRLPGPSHQPLPSGTHAGARAARIGRPAERRVSIPSSFPPASGGATPATRRFAIPAGIGRARSGRCASIRRTAPASAVPRATGSA